MKTNRPTIEGKPASSAEYADLRIGGRSGFLTATANASSGRERAMDCWDALREAKAEGFGRYAMVGLVRLGWLTFEDLASADIC
jgi:hypothetical protein